MLIRLGLALVFFASGCVQSPELAFDNPCDPGADSADAGCDTSPSGEGEGEGCDDPPSSERCDGADNDCDGVVDEQVPPVECWGDVPVVNRGIGRCVAGRQACVDGRLGPCEGAVAPAEPVCQPRGTPQVDEDCDGEPDEGLSPICGLCPHEYADGVEVCGGDDEDCDGAVDEDSEAQTAVDPAHCGACGNDCNVRGGVACNADFECVDGGCRFVGCRPGFVDLDGDGCCECGVEDEAIGFDDLDCDGVVGASRDQRFIFVAPSLSDALAGTGAAHAGWDEAGRPVAPFTSLDAALAEVALRRGDGVVEAVTIVLEVGVYALPAGLDVPDGVSILGGYRYEGGEPLDLRAIEPEARAAALAATHGWRRFARSGASDMNTTRFRGHHALLRYRDLTLRTVLDNVVVQADDAPAGGESSAAVVATNVGPHLQITHSALRAGLGGDGLDGDDGPDGLRDANGGGDGTDADDAGASPGLGGSGGRSPICAGGLEAVDPGRSVASGGDGGDSAEEGRDGARSDPGQRLPLGGRPGAGTPGESGQDGSPGPHGFDSAPGPVDGFVFGAPIPWSPRGSADAGDGTPGAGGGGGGGGQADPGRPADRPGGGGGGGGNGGCPGEGGGQAGGGGGSFGLVVDGGAVRLFGTRIETTAGGAGGDGGDGGVGRPGGLGGSGGAGSGCGGACTAGGDGGDGGDGGCGGNAGGAAGGPSVAILRVASAGADLAASTVRFVQGPDSEELLVPEADVRQLFLFPGVGGDGGRGGAAGAACGGPAEDGPPGVVIDIGCCRSGASCSAGAPGPLRCPE